MSNTLPRPKPPGRTRPQRPSLSSFEPNEANAPPPPYAHDGEVSFMGPLRDDFDLSRLGRGAIEDKSKEELSSLLIQASSTLSARQNDLTMAASIGQELVQINKDLQAKYDALQAQRSPITPFAVLNEPIAPDLRRGAQLSTSSDRRIQEAISLLQSQNEMLMTQVRHLEEESFESQKQGKKRIMLLEKEMSLLRSGLELSQQRAHELESHLEEDRGREVRRMVHHKRLNALRQRLARPDNRFRASRDFALGSETAFESDIQSPPLSPDVSSDALPDLTHSPTPSFKVLSPPVDHRQVTPASTSADETVSKKLLEKFAELEEANKGLIASQLEIKSRLERLSGPKELGVTESSNAMPPEEFILPAHYIDQDEGSHQLRRRRFGSQGPPHIRMQGTSATPFQMEFPQNHHEVELSLLDELNQAQEEGHLGSPADRSPSERNDEQHPTLPGAFVSPVKVTADMGDQHRRRAQSLMDLRSPITSQRMDEGEDGDDGSQLDQLSGSPNHPPASRSSFFVELWVFMQFCVIIVVFMFSMGRRIPAQHLR